MCLNRNTSVLLVLRVYVSLFKLKEELSECKCAHVQMHQGGASRQFGS